MADGPSYAITRGARNAYRSLFGGDKNLPLEEGSPAMRRKKKSDEATSSAVWTLGSMLKGKSPLKK